MWWLQQAFGGQNSSFSVMVALIKVALSPDSTSFTFARFYRVNVATFHQLGVVHLPEFSDSAQ